MLRVHCRFNCKNCSFFSAQFCAYCVTRSNFSSRFQVQEDEKSLLRKSAHSVVGNCDFFRGKKSRRKRATLFARRCDFCSSSASKSRNENDNYEQRRLTRCAIKSTITARKKAIVTFKSPNWCLLEKIVCFLLFNDNYVKHMSIVCGSQSQY